MATKYDNIAGLISQGSGGVDYLGNFNRGAQLAQSTSNIYDNMSAKRALMSAQESGDPYQLGAALKSAQVMAPEYATSVSAARAAPAITLGKQNQALAEDRAFVAQQALQATPEQRIQLLNQEANELASNGFDPTPVKNLIDLTMQGQHDAVTQQLQAHLAAATQGQQDNRTALEKNFELLRRVRESGDEGALRDLSNLQRQNRKIVEINGVQTIVDTDPFTGEETAVRPLSTLETEGEAKKKLAYQGEAGTQTAQVEAVAPKEAEANTAKRQSIYIDDGLEAADRIPELNRISTLLDTTKTGGIDKLQLYVKQTLGVESADEAELSAALGKAVVKQYRETFGAAFTENEGNKLDRIESGFGKSTEGNKRLIAQLRSMLERKAKRGMRAAEDRGDIDTVEEIKNAMNVNIVTPKSMTKTQLQKAADAKYGGDIEKAKLEAVKYGYIIE